MLKFKKSILLSITAFGMFLALTSCGAKSKDPTTNTDVTPTTNVTANNYTGFTAQTITQQEINPDGSTVVNVYYNRQTFKVTLGSV